MIKESSLYLLLAGIIFIIIGLFFMIKWKNIINLMKRLKGDRQIILTRKGIKTKTIYGSKKTAFIIGILFFIVGLICIILSFL